MTTTVNSNYEVYNNLGLTGSNKTETEKTKSEQFMQLMIAQLEHQDPMEPQENGEFLTQLAQMESASGIADLQTSFDTFANTMQSNSALQASSLVGRNVLIPGGESFLADGGEVNGTVDLSSSTSKLKVEVVDAAGQTIRTIDLEEQAAGEVQFKWDGKDTDGNIMPSGNYSFKASSQIGNENVAQDVLISAKVDSVSIGGLGQGLKLNILGMGQVDFTAVREIR